jgi:rhodanese-related sulfurtransferase
LANISLDLAVLTPMPAQPYINVTLSELDTLNKQPASLLIDVRDDWEFEEFNLGGINIPLADIRTRRDALLAHDPLILICSNGVRSRIAAKELRRHPNMAGKAIYHVEGGILGSEG